MKSFTGREFLPLRYMDIKFILEDTKILLFRNVAFIIVCFLKHASFWLDFFVYFLCFSYFEENKFKAPFSAFSYTHILGA